MCIDLDYTYVGQYKVYYNTICGKSNLFFSFSYSRAIYFWAYNTAKTNVNASLPKANRDTPFVHVTSAAMAGKNNGILLPKLFWPTVRKNCSSDQEKLLKFKAEGREFANFLRSLEQFIQTVKGQNSFW